MPTEIWYLALLIPLLAVALLAPAVRRWDRNAPGEVEKPTKVSKPLKAPIGERAQTIRAPEKAPESAAPDGCERTYDGHFEISIIQAVDDSSSKMVRHDAHSHTFHPGFVMLTRRHRSSASRRAPGP